MAMSDEELADLARRIAALPPAGKLKAAIVLLEGKSPGAACAIIQDVADELAAWLFIQRARGLTV